MRSILAFALLALASPVLADPSAITSDEAAQIELNLERGANLYRYDQSAWHVTDAAMPVLSNAAMQVARGYVTTPAKNGLKTTFFGQVEGKYVGLYSAVWTGSEIVEPRIFPPDQKAKLSEEEIRLITARKIALESISSLDLCGPRPNVVVVPGADSLVHVYVLTPQVAAESYPFGGHHRIDVREDKVISTRKFANSCIEASKAGLPTGAKSAGLFITHLLDSVPTEVHVFTAMATRLPIFVGITSTKKMFEVDPGGNKPTIRLIKE